MMTVMYGWLRYDIMSPVPSIDHINEVYIQWGLSNGDILGIGGSVLIGEVS